MKIGCGTVLFRRFDLERSLAAIREIGFTRFETQAVGPWCPHVNVEKDDPEKLVRLKNKFGFEEITGLWSLNGNMIANPNSVASGIRTIEWAAAAGIGIVHTGDGHKPQDMSEDYAFGVLTEKLSAILEAAEKHGVKVAIEPHGTFSLTGDGLSRMLTLGNEKVLGINYDACNIFRAGYVESGNNRSGWQSGQGGEDALQVLHRVVDRVVHCHVKDIDSRKNCVAVGDGLVDCKGCIEALLANGYDGVFSVETEGLGEFDEIVELAAKSYDYLKRFER